MPGFAAPLAFLLLPLPLLMHWLRRPRGASSDALRVPPSVAELFSDARGASRQALFHRMLPAAIWFLLILAIAGPQRMETLDIRPASGRDIVLALDMSGSMEKKDFALDGRTATRLEAVKAVATRFVEGRQGDRVGLLVFGDRPFFAMPITFDVRAVSRAIAEATIGISGRSTAISDGLGLALKRLVSSDAKSRVIILLSDGADTKAAVAPEAAAAIARQHGIRIHTIAMGPKDIQSEPGAEDAVDARTLGLISEASGGTMFRVRTTADLSAVTASIDSLEPSPTSAPPVTYAQEYWVWPAGLALLFATLFVVGTRRFGA